MQAMRRSITGSCCWEDIIAASLPSRGKRWILQNARKNLEQRIANLLAEAKPLPDFPSDNLTAEQSVSLLRTEKARCYLADFIQALEEDISTPRALSVLQQVVKDKGLEASEAITLIRIFDTVLALHLIEEAAALHTGMESVDNAEEIERLVAERTEAKRIRTLNGRMKSVTC